MRSNTRLLLRMVAGFYAFFAVGHTGGTFAPPANGPAEVALLQSMRDFRFPIMGVTRSHWDFYFGMNLTVTVYLGLMAVLAWQLATLSQSSPRQILPLVRTIFLATAVTAALSWIYFFAVPGLVATILTVLLALTLRALSKAEANGRA